jgi:hypothetical protein
MEKDNEQRLSEMSRDGARMMVRPELPPLPKFMQNLPVDPERGFVVPWFVDWFNGKPEFRAMDRRKLVKAINEKRCWVCGNKLFGEEVYVIGPMCLINRISSEPPSHRECARYSALACPFLSRPHMTRREGNLPAPKREGAGILIERNPGAVMLYFTRRHRLLSDNGGVLWELGRPFNIEWYAKGKEAQPWEVWESFNTGLPRLREISEQHGEDMALFEQKVKAAYRFMPPPLRGGEN